MSLFLQTALRSAAGSEPATPAFFTGQKTAPDYGTPRPLHHSPGDWVAVVFLVCFILLAWVQVFFPKRMKQIVQAPFSRRYLNQLIRDGNLFGERITVVLGTVYLLAVSLLIYEINQRYLSIAVPGLPDWGLYLAIAASTLALLSLKAALIRFLGVIFRTREPASEYLHNMILYSLFAGPVILTGQLIVVYHRSEWVLLVLLALFGLISLFRFYRGFLVGLTLRKFSYLFLFVYLCSLEILPILVLVKILLDYSKTAGV